MEPFEQDFGYLADAVSYTFEMIQSGLYRMPLNDADRFMWSMRAKVVADTYAQRSSVGQLPQARYNEALEDRGRFDPPMFNMDRWLDLYLLDVLALTIRLGGSGVDEAGKGLDELRRHIAQPPTGEWHETELALVAGAKERLQVGIEAVKQAMISAANNSTTTATAKAPKPNGRPDLKTIALFRALRYVTGDGAADITQANAQQVAAEAGLTAKSSGKELRAHFHRYALAMNKVSERTKDSKRPGDIEKRYDAAIAMLGPWPAALALAESERIIVRTRSQGVED